ncbi:LysR family transcriptional regulator [Tenacibaculum sp. KUL152]|nr:LysR family transcriptional regulator [Tenacibaculum sp. KUL152]
MLHLDDLAMFVTIADLHNISAAARQLDMPKATLSRRLSEYEKQLGITLFVRTTRAVTLTTEGNDLYQLAKPIVDDAFDLVTSLRQPAKKVQGYVTVSATNAIGEYLLWPSLQVFSRQFPGIQVELMLTEARVNLIQQGIDIAVRMGPLEDSELVARPLLKVHRMLVATPTFCERHGRVADLERLATLPAIVQSKTWQSFKFEGGKDIKLNWSLATSNLKLVKQAILNHNGLGVLPDFMIEDELATGKLIELLPNTALPHAQASLVTPKRRYRSSAIQVLLEFLLQELKKNP